MRRGDLLRAHAKPEKHLLGAVSLVRGPSGAGGSGKQRNRGNALCEASAVPVRHVGLGVDLVGIQDGADAGVGARQRARPTHRAYG